MEYRAWNHLAPEGEETISEHIIRRLVILGIAMRTSSRPVDMILSILGVCSVQDAFADKVGAFKESGRFRATVALVSAVFHEDTDDVEDNGAPCSLLLDVPLWRSLKVIGQRDATTMPSLTELAHLLDDSIEGVALISDNSAARITSAPLSEWSFAVDDAEGDESSSVAAAITLGIPEADFLKVYHGETARHVVHHEDEGMIELCRRLEIEGEADGIIDIHAEDLSDLFVFGWSLRPENHPFIRFYKFDISHLFK
ncbi:hypothetical protein K438DRAFT_1849868 [Mycena galopus ATCC 62051]|nr:hypothetical protein K438DRAFT_1849868 [Mycena galopus ATCC 62051]